MACARMPLSCHPRVPRPSTVNSFCGRPAIVRSGTAHFPVALATDQIFVCQFPMFINHLTDWMRHLLRKKKSTRETATLYPTKKNGVSSQHLRQNSYRKSGCGGNVFELLKAVILVICCGVFEKMIKAVMEKIPLRGNLCPITDFVF